MAVELNHTIVWSTDPAAGAAFLAEVLGLDPPTRLWEFHVVTAANGVSLDYLDAEDPAPQHYAFLISEDEFDQIYSRIRARQLPFWADPGRTRLGEIGHGDGGRGLYFEDPDGHLMEVITRPYGSGDPATPEPSPSG